MADTANPEPLAPAASAAGDIRLILNPLTGEYLAQSPGRMSRREGARDCPFCADLTSGRVPPGTRAWLRPNDFPALRPPVGEAVILIYSADHTRTFADLAPEEAELVVDLWRDVYADLAPRYACVMSWETCGAEIGQTQYHPHGQTFGVAVVPPVIARELASAEQAAAAGAGCPFCGVLREEERGPRVVAATPHWLAFVPPYARYPYEVHVYARRHVPAIDGLERQGAEARELAALLPRIVRAYNRVYQAPMPYMLAVHQLADARFHLHLELLPVGRAPGKLKFAASSESAWGFWINDSLPEIKAGELREALAADERAGAGA
ncbi:MAG TPA: hypothetical protein VGN32_03070 [Ktedonobacterales bacterium]|jgi:UDPglucose--hexose-1-phosphate uridylyltransferase|nr:hypothetical protein [Ktedonobacterales bacterium]